MTEGKTLDMAKVGEWERLAERAAKGPWRVVSDYPALAIAAGNFRVVQTPNQNNYQHYGPSCAWCGVGLESDAAFIAASRDAVPAMAAEIRRLRAKLGETL